MTVVYFVRHTDVENPQDIFYGRMSGFGLSHLGREQATRTARILAEEKVTALYSSPMLRARQTARIIGEPHKLRPKVTWLLAEIRTGWQGRPFTDLDAIGYDFFSQPLHRRDETLGEIWGRIKEFTEGVRERHAGGVVVAVTHGDVCMVARAGYGGLPMEVASIRVPYVYTGKGSLTRLHFTSDHKETKPVSIKYFDPNGSNDIWSRGWVLLDERGARVD